MKLAIIGGRTFKDFELLSKTVQSKSLNITLIISGGAKGADEIGVRYALENNIPTKIFLPEWDKYGKAAGPIRNELIIKSSDLIIAFWDGNSKGTKDSIDKARKLGKRLIVVRYK